MKKILLALLISTAVPMAALAHGGTQDPKQVDWAFDGPLGKFDKPSVQRGLQIYKEVCSACHSLKRVPFRKLQDIGLSEAEVKSFAAGYQIHDGPNDQGEMFDRPGRPSDYFPAPYANDKAARNSNNGALPPDQSLLVKAREDGPNYIYSILTGYQKEAPAGVTVPPGSYYNPYYPGGVIKMPPPLSDNQVTYQDGTKASLDQEAKDIVNFLQWAAEPEMEQRKHMGVKVMLFLGVMSVLFYLAKKRIWGQIEH